MGIMTRTGEYATLPLDIKKRHFVFGDIHGRMKSFLNLLDVIDYNKDTDCLYSVGDLIDRGPLSVEAIEFFKQDNCYAVRGNHEQMLVNYKHWEQVWLYPPNGGPATLDSLDANNLELDWLVDYCKSTPIILDVGDDDDHHAFRLVHAENPFWCDDKTLLRDVKDGSDELGESGLLWGRDDIVECLQNIEMMRPAAHNIVVNPNRSKRNIFCGHTPTTAVIRAHNTNWIDTYRSRTLTCVDPITTAVYSTSVID